jgi:hypothetical protein
MNDEPWIITGSVCIVQKRHVVKGYPGRNKIRVQSDWVFVAVGAQV